MVIEIDLSEYERHVKNSIKTSSSYEEDRLYYDNLIEKTVDWFFDNGYSPDTMVDSLLYSGEISEISLFEYLTDLSNNELENYFIIGLETMDEDTEKFKQLVCDFNNYEGDVRDFMDEHFTDEAYEAMFEQMIDDIGGISSVTHIDKSEFKVVRVQ